MKTAEVELLIIGAGPTGIGAALRLVELGNSDWLLCDQESAAGGLAASTIDERGFMWDMGGHVQFSHYERFDRYMDLALGEGGWLEHERESWVWLASRFVPYPFQNNLHRLPKEVRWRCVSGLLDASAKATGNGGGMAPEHFRDWLLGTFGSGLCETFLFPYNLKVWAFALETLGHRWVGERVSVPALSRVLRNVCLEEDDVSWGPNNTFRFPKFGGTGAVWRALLERLPKKNIRLGAGVTRIDAQRRRATLQGGEKVRYRHLISTMPVNRTVEMADLAGLREAASLLRYSSTHIVGIGLSGQPGKLLEKKCWMYFPEDDCPFYRVTVFSNYSPFTVPEPGRQWSLMAEVSESPAKPVDAKRVVGDVIQGMRNTLLITREDEIVSTWHRRLEFGYPTPTRDRDFALNRLLPGLERMGIYSRGRFGAWKYEVSNQDHSFAQGCEVVDRILGHSGGEGGAEPTLNWPDWVNGRRKC